MRHFSFKRRFVGITIMLLWSWMVCTSRAEEPDTLLCLPSADKMTVISKEKDIIQVNVLTDGMVEQYEFTIPEKQGEETNHYPVKDNLGKRIHNILHFPSKNANRYWSIGIGGLCLGLSSADGAPTDVGFQWSKSIEIGWLSILRGSYCFGESSVSLGIGINWRNFKTSVDDRYLLINGDGNLQTEVYSENTIGKYSRLKCFSLQFPLLYSYYFNKANVGISIGPIINLNTYSSILTSYIDLEGNNVEVSQRFYNQRPVTFDIFGDLSFMGVIGLYVRYSPQKILDMKERLNFKVLTIGLSLFI